MIKSDDPNSSLLGACFERIGHSGYIASLAGKIMSFKQGDLGIVVAIADAMSLKYYAEIDWTHDSKSVAILLLKNGSLVPWGLGGLKTFWRAL